MEDFSFHGIFMPIIDFAEVFIFKCWLFFFYGKLPCLHQSRAQRWEQRLWVWSSIRFLSNLKLLGAVIVLLQKRIKNFPFLENKFDLCQRGKGCPLDNFPMPSSNILFQLNKSFQYRNKIPSSIDEIDRHISYNNSKALTRVTNF